MQQGSAYQGKGLKLWLCACHRLAQGPASLAEGLGVSQAEQREHMRLQQVRALGQPAVAAAEGDQCLCRELRGLRGVGCTWLRGPHPAQRAKGACRSCLREQRASVRGRVAELYAGQRDLRLDGQFSVSAAQEVTAR